LALSLSRRKCMQVIKNKQLIDNHWTYVADDAPLASGNICVSLARWQHKKKSTYGA